MKHIVIYCHGSINNVKKKKEMTLQGNIVLILPDELPEKTSRGIRIPGTVKEKPLTGVVVDTGPLCETVRKGDRIQFNRKHSSIIIIDEKEYCIGPETVTTYIYE